MSEIELMLTAEVAIYQPVITDRHQVNLPVKFMAGFCFPAVQWDNVISCQC